MAGESTIHFAQCDVGQVSPLSTSELKYASLRYSSVIIKGYTITATKFPQNTSGGWGSGVVMEIMGLNTPGGTRNSLKSIAILEPTMKTSPFCAWAAWSAEQDIGLFVGGSGTETARQTEIPYLAAETDKKLWLQLRNNDGSEGAIAFTVDFYYQEATRKY